ncbi:MAG: xanthine dehydrogenase accessory protein XdhC, partial [Pseudomonadota bacterium]
MIRADALKAFLDGQRDVVEIRLTDVQGSAPREVGAKMFVSSGSACGTIGGGEMEFRAIKAAHDLLAGSGSVELELPLGPEIGQCCGGRVSIGLRRLNETDRIDAVAKLASKEAEWPSVLVFGAGHVGRALSACLGALPVRITLIDQRENELSLAQGQTAGTTIHTALPEAAVRQALPGSAFVITTHDHALDFLLTAEALSRGDAAYVGLIGSATKRATFLSWLKTHRPDLSADQLTCPIGEAGLGDKRPEVIAAHTASELMRAFA